MVELTNEVSLDFHDHYDPVAQIDSQHYAFLVSEAEFDEIFARISERGQAHWADPGLSTTGVTHRDGGRGTYFKDPDGHLMEILTRPYGSGG
jgi:catechol 2,3-dioxygenase-like lactoylglutathione lyase family enzyme